LTQERLKQLQELGRRQVFGETLDGLTEPETESDETASKSYASSTTFRPSASAVDSSTEVEMEDDIVLSDRDEDEEMEEIPWATDDVPSAWSNTRPQSPSSESADEWMRIHRQSVLEHRRRNAARLALE
jgi:hypothetical protein